jgi:hypothetical protein
MKTTKFRPNDRKEKYRLAYINGDTVDVEAEECRGVLSFLRPTIAEWDNRFISMADLKSFSKISS